MFTRALKMVSPEKPKRPKQMLQAPGGCVGVKSLPWPTPCSPIGCMARGQAERLGHLSEVQNIMLTAIEGWGVGQAHKTFLTNQQFMPSHTPNIPPPSNTHPSPTFLPCTPPHTQHHPHSTTRLTNCSLHPPTCVHTYQLPSVHSTPLTPPHTRRTAT